jgi:signal transduction histidine kinase
MLLWLVCLGTMAQAATLTAGSGGVPLSGHMAILHDPSGQLGIRDVTAAPVMNQFRPLPGGVAAGYVRGDIWLRFDLVRSQDAPKNWWLEVPNPLIDEVSLFVPSLYNVAGDLLAAPAYIERRAGEQIAEKLRDSIPYRQVVFRLVLPDQESQQFFLRLRSVNAMVTEPRLWSDQAFTANSSREDAIFGGLFTMLTVIMLIGLFVGAMIRDGAILVSAGFCISLLMILLPNEGYLQLYLLPDYPGLPDVFIGLGFVLNFYFGWEILVRLGGLGQEAPRVAAWVRRIIAVMAVPLALASVAGHYGQIAPLVQTLGQVQGLAVILITVVLVLRGNRDAKIFFFPYVTYLLLSMSRLGRNLGWFPANPLTEHGFHLGVLIQTFSLLTIAGYRLYSLRSEREKAQGEQLRLSQRHEGELEARVMARTEELNKAIEEQRQLVSMVSHEFRNPLAVVDGAAQNIARGIGADTALQQIRRAVSRMSELLVNVLAEDRLADNAQQSNMQRVNVAELAGDALQFRTPGGSDRVSLLAPDQGAFLIGDPHLIRIIFDNLLDNALKYALQGPIEVAVEAVSQANGDDMDGWLLVVRDRGPGIAPGQDIFAKYVRGDTHAAMPGTGLGLFLVARIAELHQGKVTFKNRVGGGAEIGVVLPS